MELKDVLHYYIGQKVQTPEGIDTLKAVYQDSTPVLYDTVKDYSLDELKLILRPLIEMTEEEANTLLQNHGFPYDWVNVDNIVSYAIWYDFTYPSSRRVRKNQIRFDGMNARDFHYLLSRGFDVFNLHDRGLCIYESEINTPITP